jgi:RHS repeat-associated protein
MSVYRQEASTTEPIVQKEVILYGSDRLGTLRRYLELKPNENTNTGIEKINSPQSIALYANKSYLVASKAGSLEMSEGFEVTPLTAQNGLYFAEIETEEERPSIFAREIGKKEYELKDHLGNIRVLVSDGKEAILVGATLTQTAKVLSYSNYYPFGMELPNMQYADNEAYRYGFNGKENDREWGTASLTQDYGFRLYNPAIAKFLSVDPLAKKYPFFTPYQFASNTPVQAIDLDGAEASVRVANKEFGASLVLIGNQERGIKLYGSVAGIAANNGLGTEGGLRLGVNFYSSYKSNESFMAELTGSWYMGVVFGKTTQSDNYSIMGDEFRFAGSGIQAHIKGVTWGIGGVGMLTSSYKGSNISGYMGTQYLKGGFGNTSLTLNHTNDALMAGFWLKKGLPPILGFQDNDENRTTELSATLNYTTSNIAYSAHYKVSLFTPQVLRGPDGRRRSFETGEGTRKEDGSGCQEMYYLDPKGHGTFFSFNQVGISSRGGETPTGSLFYSFGNPQPRVQNKFAHGNGYRFPLFSPSNSGLKPNNSDNSLGVSITTK